MIGNLKLEDLIACNVTQGDVPFFDGDCRGYMNFRGVMTCADVLACITDLSLWLTSTSLTIVGNDVQLGTARVDNNYNFGLLGLMLFLGNNRIDLNSIILFNIFLSDGQENEEVRNEGYATFMGLDGMRVIVSAVDTVSIGLPIPPAQYYMPGRFTMTYDVYASFVGQVPGMLTDVTIVADNYGIAGNVTLTGDGITPIFDGLNPSLILNWNTANPGNTLSLVAGDGTQIPNLGAAITLTGGSSYGAVPNVESEYMPVNRRLVLTRDDCTNQAVWLPPQCCLQTLLRSCDTQNLQISSGGVSNCNTSRTCGICGGTVTCCGGGQNLCGNCGANADIVGDMVDLSRCINTDAQTLYIDPEDPSLLCINRRHGWVLGQQTMDPPSCVDLQEINNQSLVLDGCRLNLQHGIDHSCCDSRAINICAVKHLTCDDLIGCICNEKIDWIAAGVVPMPSATDFPLPPVGPDDRNILLLYDNGDIVIRGGKRRIANADTVAGEEPGVSPKRHQTIIPMPPLSPGTVLPADRGQLETWIAQPYHQNMIVLYDAGAGVKRRVAIADALATDVPGSAPLVRALKSDSERPDDGREAFLSEPRSICEVWAFIAPRVGLMLTPPPPVDPCEECDGDTITCIDCYDNYNYLTNIYQRRYTYITTVNNRNNCYNCNNLTIIGDIIYDMKYRARIYCTTNRPIRSGHMIHSDLLPSLDGGDYARRYFPNFDTGEGRNSQTFDMIDPAREVQDSINHITIGTFDQTLPASGHDYSTTPSANNPQAGNCGKACNGGSKTIHIPITGWYNIELIGTLEVDHNVHAYRYSVLRLRAAENHTEVDFLLDTKFGGDATVGSHSVNDVAYPITKQYNHAASKIMLLEAGDILFVAVRIDPVTFRTTNTDQQDYLMNNSGGGFAHMDHTPGNASGLYVSRTPGSLILDYSNGLYGYRDEKYYTDTGLQLPWPAAMPPHLTYSVYYAPFGGYSGAENYGYCLTTFSSGNTDYHYDDGVVIVQGNPSFKQSDGSGVNPPRFHTQETREKYGGSMLSVHRINLPAQGDIILT